MPYPFCIIKRQRQKSLREEPLLQIIGAMVVLMLISAFTFTRFDFTKEKRYTLSQTSPRYFEQRYLPI